MVPLALKEKILKRKRALKAKTADQPMKKQLIKRKVSSTSTSTSNKNILKVSANELNWKPVEIPDTLDDFEGFYGLEEIDNVDVKIVNGKIEFLTKESNKISEKDAQVRENTIPSGQFEIDLEDIKEEDKEALNYTSDEEVGDGDEEIDEDVDENDKEDEKTEESKENDEGVDMKDAEDKVENEQKEAEIKKKKKETKVSTFIASKDEDNELNIPSLPVTETPASKTEKTKAKAKASSNEDDLKENTFAQVSDINIPTDEIDLPEWAELSLSTCTLNGLQKLGFKEPTEIQKTSIPLAIADKDVIGRAITGSGKTLAYGIPILEKALAEEAKSKNLPEEIRQHPTALIFTPTRELANQVMKSLRELFKFSPFSDKTVTSLTGGLSIQKQERLLSYGPRVLVATPGRCLELLEKSTSLAKKIASIDILVLDEADRMLQDGHFEEMKKILEILNNYRPKNIHQFERKWQSLIFSATFSKDLFGKLASDKKPQHAKKRKNEDEGDAEIREVLEILGKKLRFRSKPEYVDVNPTEVVANKITEAIIPCAPMERDLMLYYFVSMFPGTTLVFTNSIDSVKRLAPMLSNLGIPTVSIHSSMIQKQRLRALERFTRNSETANAQKTSSVLIASDVAARGLDISGIQHVVHYHLPRTADTYVHRSGRTARAGKEGVSVVLCSPQEASGPLRKLRSVISKTDKVADLKPIIIDSDILDQLKERLDLSAKIAQAEVASQSIQKEKSWIEKAADELGVDNIDDFEDDFLKRDRKRKEGKQLDKNNIKVLKAQLRDSLKKPIRKSGRRSYIAGGLNNIAHLLLANEGSKSVMGYLQQDALTVLKNHKKSKK